MGNGVPSEALTTPDLLSQKVREGIGGLPSEALTPLAPLSQGERGEQAKKPPLTVVFFFLPPLPLGEEGRGGEGFGGHIPR